MFFKKNSNFLNLNNLFVGLFFIVICTQFLVLDKMTLDRSMWADQASYFGTNDERQYDFLLAYGHPGGPIIEGTIVLNKLFSINYDNALFYFLLFFGSLIITLICYLIYLLKKNLFFVLTTFLVIGFHRFYAELTPTSYVASLLFVLQAFFSLYLYGNREKLKFKDILGFSILSGLIMATRIDIGFIGTLFFGIYLLPKMSIRDFIYAVFLILGSFLLFDPYMWYMPFQHISDLAYKFIYHYEFFVTTKMNLLNIFSISIFPLFSLLILFFLSIFDIKQISLNLRFYFMLLVVFIFTYFIFINSQITTVRYFVPIILMWEVLMPILILDLLSSHKLSNFIKDAYDFKHKNFIIIFILLLFCLFFVGFSSSLLFFVLLIFFLFLKKIFDIFKINLYTLYLVSFMCILLTIITFNNYRDFYFYSLFFKFLDLTTFVLLGSLLNTILSLFLINDLMNQIEKTNNDNYVLYVKVILVLFLLSCNLTLFI